ncbi:MAG: flippase-like domain-containing protein [Devosiaceae bacterium]|nr:flippase-like domain-containing protein [Devosiaceae bacterium MH13]
MSEKATESAGARHRVGLIKIAQLAALAILAVLLWHAFDGHEAARLLIVADLRWLLAAGALLTLQTLLSALRWKLTAERLGLSFSYGVAVREYYLAQFVNLSLPGGVLGDANRAYRSRQTGGFLLAGQAVIFERLAGQIGLLAVFLVGVSWSLVSEQGLNWPDWLVSSVFGVLAACLLLPLVLLVAAQSFRMHYGPLRRFGQRFVAAVLHRDVLAAQVALSLLTALCNVTAFALCAVALGANLAIVDALVLVPLILLAMLVPLSISGWGVREGAAALLFPVIGFAASAGLAASVAFGLVLTVAMLAGFALSWLTIVFRRLSLSPSAADIVESWRSR